MIGLDTNVIVRYLVQDDPEQSKIANHIFEQQLSQENKGVISPVVFCEVVWVLKRAYKQQKPKLLEVVRMLLLADWLEIMHRDAAWRAFGEYESGVADFSDYFIAQMNAEAGAKKTVTFDTAALSGRHFVQAGCASLCDARG